MNEIAIAKRVGHFLNSELDDLVYSTGMQREWIPDLGKKTIKSEHVPTELEFNPLDAINNKFLSKETKNKIKIIFCISKSLDALRNDYKHPYRKILLLKYFDGWGLTNPEIADKIGYSIHTFYEKKRIALVEFSKAFLTFQKSYKVSPIINLIDAGNSHINNDSNVKTFLNALSNRQAINLYATLLRANSNISVKQAKQQAAINYSFDKLENILNESL